MTLRQLIYALFGFCTHSGHPLLRRGRNGRMGLECPDCFGWTPIDIDHSEVAVVMAMRQEVEKWSREPREGFKVEFQEAVNVLQLRG